MSRFAPLFRSLSAMHRAGIPWSQALASAARGDPRLASAQRALDRGTSFGEAFEGVVDPLDAALIRAGEQDGSLEITLQDIAQAHEDTDRRAREGLTALLYPIALAHIAAVLMPLPDLVQGRVGAALGWAAVILVPTWAFLLWRRRARRRERPRPDRHASPPGLPPLVGPWRTRVEEADARGLEALGRLLDAGVPLDETLDLAVQAGWGGRVALDLDEARRRVQRGNDLAGAWRALPEEYARRLQTGEEAGSLGEACRRVADGLRFTAGERRRRVAVLLPVFVLLAIGGIIAWRVFRFYGDLYGNLPH